MSFETKIFTYQPAWIIGLIVIGCIIALFFIGCIFAVVSSLLLYLKITCSCISLGNSVIQEDHTEDRAKFMK